MILLAGLLTRALLTQGVQFTPQTDLETFQNLIITNSKLLLGTSEALYRLDSALSMEAMKPLTTQNRLLISDIENGTLDGAVLSCDEERCLLLDPENFDNVTWDVPRSMVLLSGGGNAAGHFSIGPNGTSDITFGEPLAGSKVRRIVKGALRNVGSGSANMDELFRYAVLNEEYYAHVDYLTTFVYSSYIYFVYFTSSNIHMVRFCQKDNGKVSGFKRIFTTLYEIELECGSPDRDAIITSAAATYLPSSRVFSGPVIFLSVTKAKNTDEKTVVCAFEVDDINQKMLDKLVSCSNGTGFTRSPQVPCPTHFTEIQRLQQINVSNL